MTILLSDNSIYPISYPYVISPSILESAVEIDLSNQGLISLPPFVYEAHLNRLQRLNLANNSLIVVPNDFNSLFPNLVSLDVSNNNLDYLPFVVPTTLNTVIARKNRLCYMPNYIGCVRHLDVRENQGVILGPNRDVDVVFV